MSDVAPTSFWLVPAEPIRTDLRSHIADLAGPLGSPVFDPHITLASALVDDAAAATVLARVAAATAPMDLHAGPTENGPNRFHSVFVTFDDSRIHELAAQVCAALDISFEPEELHPHLSLIYAADLPVHVRAAIGAAHTFEGVTMRFDALVANRSTGSADDVARWSTFVVEPLSGPASS